MKGKVPAMKNNKKLAHEYNNYMLAHHYGVRNNLLVK